MAFKKMGAFSFNHADQSDELNVPADIAKSNFDSRANELKDALNITIDLLNSTADGNSGADNVGATAISGVTGTSVQAQMESMKGLVDGKAASGHNHDSSYAPTNLAGEGRTTETVKGNADAIAAHLAEDASLTTKGHVQLQTTVDLSETKALTPKALNNHQSDLTSHGEVLSLYRSDKDSNGVYVTLQWKRPDGTLAKKSVLSGGTSPKYTTRMVTYYDAAGTAVVLTKSYALTYTGDELISEVLS